MAKITINIRHRKVTQSLTTRATFQTIRSLSKLFGIILRKAKLKFESHWGERRKRFTSDTVAELHVRQKRPLKCNSGIGRRVTIIRTLTIPKYREHSAFKQAKAIMERANICSFANETKEIAKMDAV